MKRKPLWLQAVLVALVLSAALGVLHALGLGLWLLVVVAVVMDFVGLLAPSLGVRWLNSAVQAYRTWAWRHESGRHHSFAGHTLHVDEQFGQPWLAAASLQRVLGKTEDETVTAARMPGQWQRNDDGAVMLKVSAVVHHLGHMPGRDDPHVQRFRRYLERDVLYPASKRNPGV